MSSLTVTRINLSLRFINNDLECREDNISHVACIFLCIGFYPTSNIEPIHSPHIRRLRPIHVQGRFTHGGAPDSPEMGGAGAKRAAQGW